MAGWHLLGPRGPSGRQGPGSLPPLLSLLLSPPLSPHGCGKACTLTFRTAAAVVLLPQTGGARDGQGWRVEGLVFRVCVGAGCPPYAPVTAFPGGTGKTRVQEAPPAGDQRSTAAKLGIVGAGSAGGPDLQQSQAPRLHVCCASLSCPGGEPPLPQGAGQAVDTKPEHLDLSRRRLGDSTAHPRWQSIAQGGIQTCFHSPPWSDSFRDIRVMCGRSITGLVAAAVHLRPL